jgi:hypothetical protein
VSPTLTLAPDTPHPHSVDGVECWNTIDEPYTAGSDNSPVAAANTPPPATITLIKRSIIVLVEARSMHAPMHHKVIALIHAPIQLI